MKKWWKRKKEKTRRHKKKNDGYNFFDFMLDALFWIPEVIFLPFRIIFWVVRGMGRFIESIFDII